MAREKNNSPQARTNRNNRKRGASFEKKVAEILDMEIVPYSGSNSRFGWNDVRDSETKDDAWWMGECKNRVCGIDEPFTIENDWIVKMTDRAYDTGALPFLAFMKAGRSEKYILINERAWSVLREMGDPTHLAIQDIEYKKGSHNQVNIKIPHHDLMSITNGRNGAIRVRLVGTRPWYYAMSIETFRWILKSTGHHYKWAMEDK